MILGIIGVSELAIVLVVALVIFGGGKLAGVGKSLGQSVREFKDEVNKDNDSVQNSSGPEHREDKNQ